jgi:1-acyl-sn-glycerol-3-phosphate acyltransferase
MHEKQLKIPLAGGQIISWTQLLTRPLFVLIRLLLCRQKIVTLSVDQLQPGMRYIVAANHGSWFDPIVILVQLPYGVMLRLRPLRVMVLNKLFDSPLRPFIASLGSFPVKPHKRYRYGLELARYFLEQGDSLGIFPEGRRNLDGTVKPRRGVAELANTPNTRLIPVRVLWKKRFFGLIPNYAIHVGAPVDATKMSADEIMDQIYSLPLSLERSSASTLST